MFAVALLAPFAAGARNVGLEEAREAAAYYMDRNTLEYGVKTADLSLIHQIDNPELGVPAAYVFNVSDWGWIIMTGSTAISPVIGFGDEGNLDAWEELPPAMRDWVETYAAAVADVQNQDVEGKFDEMAAWTDLFNRTLMTNAKDSDPRVILMNLKWSQGENRNPTYNKRCPYDSASNKYTFTGCVATAMSQILRYYAFPVAASGGRVTYVSNQRYQIKLRFDSLRFNYAQMPVRLTSLSSTNQVNEVARLCFAAGVSVRMNYGIDGSGAHSEDVPVAMANNFKYTMGVQLRRSMTSTDNFLQTLRNDLLMHRPVYMSGASSSGGGADAAGHAWVACGYRTDDGDQYYMNWGWGSNQADGWFDFRANTSIRPGGTGYNFNVGQDIITNMVPPHADSSEVDFLTAIDLVESNTTLAPAYPNPAWGTVTLPYSTTTAGDMHIFSIDGKLVGTRRLQPGSGEVTLDVANMPAGIYIYRLGGQSGKFIVR